MKVRVRLTLAVVAVVVLVSVVAALVSVLGLSRRDHAEVDRALAAIADQIQPAAIKSAGNGSLISDNPSTVRVLTGTKVTAQVGVKADFPAPAETGYSTITVGGVSWRSLVRSVAPGQLLQVLQSLDGVDRRESGNARLIALVAFLTVLVAAAGTWFATGLWQPVRPPAEETVRSAPSAELPTPMAPRVPPPVVADGQREVSEQELRTPLANIGADLEKLLDNPELPATQRHLILAGMAVDHQRVMTVLDGS